MANSKYEYVRKFEKSEILLPSTYIVVRLDGRAFHRLSEKYQFKKPNDRRALDLMNACAVAVLRELPDIVIAYGISDEFSFIFEQDTKLFERRESKLISIVTSTFTAYYVHQWQEFFPGITLSAPLPTFDGRAIIYPNSHTLRDYLNWRQVDCHINNLYNTVFWALVQQGNLSKTNAESRLKGTVAADKNEILFSQFSINYNNEEEIFKKGTLIYREYEGEHNPKDVSRYVTGGVAKPKSPSERGLKRQRKADITISHVDIIGSDFWEARPWILGYQT